jgi:hypothetical protein
MTPHGAEIEKIETFAETVIILQNLDGFDVHPVLLNIMSVLV